MFIHQHLKRIGKSLLILGIKPDNDMRIKVV